jgi:uncharacterized protein Yka (UPF0111/DUF47 family)
MSSDSVLGRIFSKARNIRLLPPRDARFYVLFGEMAETLIETSSELITIFSTPIERRHEIERRIHAASIRGTRIVDSMEDLLRIAQQPPFDRADIAELMDGMFKVLKYIKHASNRFVIYNFPSSDKEMRELAPNIHNACLEIANAIKSLPRNRKIESHCHAVERYEKEADDIYHQGLGRRFAEIRQNRFDTEKMIDLLCETAGKDYNPLDILAVERSTLQYTRHVAIFFILRELYVELEKASDSCTGVTVCLKRMVSTNV